MNFLKIIGGLIIILGACITLASPLILFLGLGMLENTPNSLFGFELTQFSGIVMAGVVFIIGAIIVLVGKVLWERE
ncbi:MAG: hypothetical protein ACFFFH_08435 [Candidatus Thorarchaeota archaeon]